MPQVSVLCPLYNHAAFIGDTIASVQAQTCPDWELLIVDDASTDASADQAEQLAAADSRIRVLRHASNQGISQALATAWYHATAPYIAMLGSDDRFVPDKLALQLAWLEAHPTVGAVFSNAQTINAQGQVINAQLFPPAQALSRAARIQQFFWHGNHLCGSSIMVRRPVLAQVCQPFNQAFHQLEDYDRNFKLALVTELAVMPDTLVQYRQHDHNISQATDFSALRTRWETLQLLLDVAQTMTPDDAQAAFADYANHPDGTPVTLTPADVPYVLAQAALDKGPFHHHKLFALHTLADGLKQPAVRERWAAAFGFSANQYHRLTGLFDFFAYEKSTQASLPQCKSRFTVPMGPRYALELRWLKARKERTP